MLVQHRLIYRNRQEIDDDVLGTFDFINLPHFIIYRLLAKEITCSHMKRTKYFWIIYDPIKLLKSQILNFF